MTNESEIVNPIPMPIKKVGFYIRVSTEKQAKLQEGSLVSQEQRLLAELERQNRASEIKTLSIWGNLVHTYVEEGRSGKDTNRPQYQRMLRDIQNGVIDAIMVTELSRLS